MLISGSLFPPGMQENYGQGDVKIYNKEAGVAITYKQLQSYRYTIHLNVYEYCMAHFQPVGAFVLP